MPFYSQVFTLMSFVCGISLGTLALGADAPSTQVAVSSEAVSAPTEDFRSLLENWAKSNKKTLDIAKVTLPTGKFEVPSDVDAKKLSKFIESYLDVYNIIVNEEAEVYRLIDYSKFSKQWLHSLVDADQIAKDQKKKLLIKLSAVWCEPCTYQAKDFYLLQSAKHPALDNYVLVSLDVDHLDKQSEIFLSKHKIYGEGAKNSGLPTIVLANSLSSKTVKKQIGAGDKERLIKVLTNKM